MATVSAAPSHGDTVVQIDNSAAPQIDLTSSPPEIQTLDCAATSTTHSAPPQISIDPKDPESYLKRCSGSNKRGERCSATIGKRNDTHPAYLPTCHAHRDQRRNAGWCQFLQPDGERCGRLFAWTPPYFELCYEHIGHPDTPCHLLGLPMEIRLEIFRYLMPEGPIDSSGLDTVPFNANPSTFQSFVAAPPPASRGTSNPRRRRSAHFSRQIPEVASSFSVLNLFLTNRQIYAEAKNFLYSTVPFTIDIRKDGTFMCGRRLLEPRRADGLPHCAVDGSEAIAKKFVANFDFAAVKNYNVDILVENGAFDAQNPVPFTFHGSYWDEEVEIYDIRDYVGVAVSGILSKAKSLCRLNVRLGLSKFKWSEEMLLLNTKRIIGPFERLRNVVQPKFLGVFDGSSQSTHIGYHQVLVPRLSTHTYLLGPGNLRFDKFRADWEKWLAQSATAPPRKAPIRAMFTEFKSFYSKLQTLVPDVHRSGRHAFLHRARVARESEDVEAFRELRNELILYWNMYLEREEARQADMNRRMSRMLDMDTYPSPDDFTPPPSASSSSSASSSGTCNSGWKQAQYSASGEGCLKDPVTTHLNYLQQQSPRNYQDALVQLERRSAARYVATLNSEKQRRAQKQIIMTPQGQQQRHAYKRNLPSPKSPNMHPPVPSHQNGSLPSPDVSPPSSSSSSSDPPSLPVASVPNCPPNSVSGKTTGTSNPKKSPKPRNSTAVPSYLSYLYEKTFQQLCSISSGPNIAEFHFITIAEAESRSHEQVFLSPLRFAPDGPRLGSMTPPWQDVDICFSAMGLHYFRKDNESSRTITDTQPPITYSLSNTSPNNVTHSSPSHTPAVFIKTEIPSPTLKPSTKPDLSLVNTNSSHSSSQDILDKKNNMHTRKRRRTSDPDSPSTPMQTTAWPMNPPPPDEHDVLENFDFDSFLHTEDGDLNSWLPVDGGWSGDGAIIGDRKGKGKVEVVEID